MKRTALLVLIALIAGCGEPAKFSWDYVTAEERREFFMECVRLAPPGAESVEGCNRAESSWAYRLGHERMDAARKSGE